MTVHKALSSELERLALILPNCNLPLNTCEIIYTALTHYRRGVVIIVARKIVEAGITKTISRDGGMVAKLRGIAS